MRSPPRTLACMRRLPRCAHHRCGCRSEESIAYAFKAATEHFKLPLTTLVNNAAVIPLPDPTKNLDVTDMQEFDDIFAASSSS